MTLLPAAVRRAKSACRWAN